MAKVPALVTNWRRVARTVVSSIDANIDVIAPPLQRELFPDDPEGDDVRRWYLARARWLERKVDVFQECALGVLAEQGDDSALRKNKEAAVAALRDVTRRTRSIAEGIYDPPTLKKLGLTGDTPANPDALVTYAANAASNLRTVALPPVDVPGVTFDPAERAARIEEALRRVEEAVRAQSADERENQGALRARDEAEEELRRAYVATADGFAADAAAAGFPRIAERVRPTSRRRAGLPEPEDLEGGDDTDGTDDVGA